MKKSPNANCRAVPLPPDACERAVADSSLSVRDWLDSSGKTTIVTGGSRRIGLQVAFALGEMGAKGALTARVQDELDLAHADLDGAAIECLMMAGDLANLGVLPGIGEAVLSRWEHDDILVSNTGCNWAAPAADDPDDGWRNVMHLNIDAQVLLSHQVGKRSRLPRKSPLCQYDVRDQPSMNWSSKGRIESWLIFTRK